MALPFPDSLPKWLQSLWLGRADPKPGASPGLLGGYRAHTVGLSALLSQLCYQELDQKWSSLIDTHGMFGLQAVA